MAGIYIHIPFCRRACHYCNFHFSTQLSYIDEMLGCIVQEITLQKQYLTTPIETIYFGGGTPSIIDTAWIHRILTAIYSVFDVIPQPEITLEANPDDITTEKVASWHTAGINRLSIGIQSFVEQDLQWMNRAHNAQQALDCIKIAQQNNITNLSIDLIYGTPQLSNEQWLENIATAMNLEIQHLSCYALTVEPNTALDTMIMQRKKEPVDANKAAQQMMLLMDIAPDYALEHYEISNLSKAGYRSKHNTNYWRGVHYVGIGPGAHSYNGNSRQWNVSNNALYIKSIQQKQIPFEREILSEKDKLNEYIMTSLRTSEGMDLDLLQEKYNYTVHLETYIKDKLITVENNHAILTPLGKLRADGIASDLFLM